MDLGCIPKTDITFHTRDSEIVTRRIRFAFALAPQLARSCDFNTAL